MGLQQFVLSPGHQFHRPASTSNAGLTAKRITVASSKTATASVRASRKLLRVSLTDDGV